MNTQSSVMKDINASRSWRFQASLKAASVSVVTCVEVRLRRALLNHGVTGKHRQFGLVLIEPDASIRARASGLAAYTWSALCPISNATRHAQWESLFGLQDGPSLPLQSGCRLSVVQAILDGRLPLGSPLPSSRELAKVLGVSRNTVTAAYVQLVDDGLPEARPRSGVFVTLHARTSEARPATPVQPDAKSAGLPPDWSRRVLSLAGRSTHPGQARPLERLSLPLCLWHL